MKGTISLDSYEAFRTSFLTLTGIDLADYKSRRLIERTVDKLMDAHNFSAYQDYAQALSEDERLREELIDHLTVKVSEFFRNPNLWEALESRYIPELTKHFGPALRVWSAGCGHGEEAYSLVLSLSRSLPLDMICVYATDISAAALARAQTAVYADTALSNVKAALLEKSFIRRDSCCQVRPELCSQVRLARHDLLSDRYPESCHLIACRNTMYYFSPAAQQRVQSRLAGALAPHGILFVGTAEPVPNCESLGLKKRDSFFYEKA